MTVTEIILTAGRMLTTVTNIVLTAMTAGRAQDTMMTVTDILLTAMTAGRMLTTEKDIT